MNEYIQDAIESLYTTFNGYKLKDKKNITCFDFGPSAEETLGISLPLRDIPERVIIANSY